MANYLTMFDPNEANKDFLFSADLDDHEVTVEISRVEVGALTGENGKKTKKPVLSFRGKQKKLAINKTNGKTIAKLYGKDTDGWVGKLITIFPTTTKFGGDTVDCIRVKPHVPRASSGGNGGNGQRDTKPAANTTSAPAASTTPTTTTTLPPADLTPGEIAELERQEREEFARG